MHERVLADAEVAREHVPRLRRRSVRRRGNWTSDQRLDGQHERRASMLRREDAVEPQRAPTDTAHCMGDRRVELAVYVLPVARVLGAYEALEDGGAAVDVAH